MRVFQRGLAGGINVGENRFTRRTLRGEMQRKTAEWPFPQTGMAKRKVDPCPGSDSNRIRPMIAICVNTYDQ